MNKAYSNKALPPGTVLREWRLEEVLGVGGFGIVYKGRGIYFNELVAIKEYFPSAISERKDGDTVVPIDSNAEEVHALGLKKFVEEAKLLWNLSTPTRHPNIVSVRSLFEIHGTAYIVMDFEDGFSLSKLLRQGRRFNESSLLALVKPIAEGLDRAHRVGVLHRDIKPPNILVNEDGRPVLIDFGSARFESGDATNTKVTFHTPPYAAIEQYVKTYAQGPWTDIYALGVVMHECVTGEKPPEVLERMHGGLGKPLAEGNWPGYSHTFLAAVDAAMIIRPDDRPQSISAWLALFDRDSGSAVAPGGGGDDDDATRVYVFDSQNESIKPVAPQPSGFDAIGKIETAVPLITSEAEFKGPGQHTKASQKAADHKKVPDTASVVAKEQPPKPGPTKLAAKVAGGGAVPVRKKRSWGPLLIGGAAIGAVVLGGGWYLTTRGSAGTKAEPVFASQVEAVPLQGEAGPVVAAELTAPGDLVAAVGALVAAARKNGAPPAAVRDLADAGANIGGLFSGLGAITAESEKAAQAARMSALAQSASATFANALVREAEGRSLRLRRELPWADPLRPNGARGESPERQKIANDLRVARARLGAAAAGASSAAEPGLAIALAHQALAASGRFAVAYSRAFRSDSVVQDKPIAPLEVIPSVAASVEPSLPAPDLKAAGSASELFPQKYRSFGSVVSSARGIAANVIRLGNGSEPGSGASDDEKARYRIRRTNSKTAQDYVRYLDTIVNSMRGLRTEREVDQLIASANQTKLYLNGLQSQSSAAK